MLENAPLFLAFTIVTVPKSFFPGLMMCSYTERITTITPTKTVRAVTTLPCPTDIVTLTLTITETLCPPHPTCCSTSATPSVNGGKIKWFKPKID